MCDMCWSVLNEDILINSLCSKHIFYLLYYACHMLFCVFSMTIWVDSRGTQHVQNITNIQMFFKEICIWNDL